MQNQGRILRLIVLIFLNIIVLALAVAVSNFTYALENLELHQKSLDYLYENHTSSNAGIAVGKSPSAIGVDELAHRIYVANADDNTLSVIDTQTNNRIKDIHVVGFPSAIGVDEHANRIYVVKLGGNVSIIDKQNNTRIKDIPVGSIYNTKTKDITSAYRC